MQHRMNPIVISADSVAYNPNPDIEIPDPRIIATQIENVLNEINSEEGIKK